MGVRLATIAFESEVAAPRTLEATMPEDAPRPAQAAIRTALWRDLCLVGTVTQNLADHVPVAWGWGEDVQVLGSGGRGVWAAASVRRAQAQSCGADRPGLPIIVIQEVGLDGF